jgi:site-specific recombinase XerD
MKHLSVEQVGRLVEVAGETVRQNAPDRSRLVARNELFLKIIYQHGLRVSEAISLTRGHVQRGFLVIRGKKKGKRTTEKLDPSTLELWNKVTECILAHTLVFPFTRQWGSELFHRAAEAATIDLAPRQGIHSLRHSIAHHMLDSGAPLPVVQKALRHRSIGSTGVYLEADGASVDQWRAKAVAGSTFAAVPATSAAEVRGEMQRLQRELKRLAELAASMQDVQDAPEPAPVCGSGTGCEVERRISLVSSGFRLG